MVVFGVLDAPVPLQAQVTSRIDSAGTQSRGKRVVIRCMAMSTSSPKLHSIALTGFRSLADETIELDNPTFLVGRNGAGKSNLADAFSFIAEAMAMPLLTVFDRRGGYRAVVSRDQRSQQSQDGIAIAVELRNISVMEKLQATYGFALQPHGDDGFKVRHEVCRVLDENDSVRGFFDRTETGFASNPAVDLREPVDVGEGGETIFKPAVAQDALVLPFVAGLYPHPFREVHDFLSRMRVYKIDPLALRDPQNPDEGRRLLANGGNAASVLQRLERQFPEELPNVRDLLAAIVPGIVDVTPTRYGNNKLSLEFTQRLKSDAVTFDAADMSDGTLRALGLITAVFQLSKPRIVVIEEPELTMHPGAHGAILDLLQHASERMQVVVTTHSPDILDARWIEERHLRLLEWADGRTRVSKLSEASRNILDEGIMRAGELLRSNALRAEGRPS